MEHQKVAVSWLVAREKLWSSQNPGSILADDLGLGKSYTAIALVKSQLATHPRTLLIVPKNLMENWSRELQARATPLDLTWEVVERPTQEVPQKDIVVVSYEFAKKFAIPVNDTLICGNCSTNVAPAKYASHRKKCIRTIESSCCLVDADHYDPFLESLSIDGSARYVKPSTHAREGCGNWLGPWSRIIVDEAHNLRNTETVLSRGCRAFEAQCRLAITGTPIVNWFKEILGILAFLRVQPIAARFCHSCQRFFETGVCGRHSMAAGSSFFALWSEALQRTKASFDGLAWLTAVRSGVLFGRKKEDIQDLVLPELCIIDHPVVPSPLEVEYMGALGDAALSSMSCSNAARLALFNTGRAVSSTPEALSKGALQQTPEMVGKRRRFGVASVDDGVFCGLCDKGVFSVDIFDGKVGRGECGHYFHEICVTDRKNEVFCCTRCQALIDAVDLASLEMDEHSRALMRNSEAAPREVVISSKFLSVEEIARLVFEKSPANKIVVFSEFSQVLKLLADYLASLTMSVAVLTGDIQSNEERTRIVDDFISKSGNRILCVTTTLGSEGLNLQAACCVILMEAAWSPVTESQAIARCHRIGQSSRVIVYRLTSGYPGELRALQLQQLKTKGISVVLSAQAPKMLEVERRVFFDVANKYLD